MRSKNKLNKAHIDWNKFRPLHHDRPSTSNPSSPFRKTRETLPQTRAYAASVYATKRSTAALAHNNSTAF